MWGDEEYLQRKEGRTVRDDIREIIPTCIITVSDITKSSYMYVKRRTFSLCCLGEDLTVFFCECLYLPVFSFDHCWI